MELCSERPLGIPLPYGSRIRSHANRSIIRPESPRPARVRSARVSLTSFAPARFVEERFPAVSAPRCSRVAQAGRLALLTVRSAHRSHFRGPHSVRTTIRSSPEPCLRKSEIFGMTRELRSLEPPRSARQDSVRSRSLSPRAPVGRPRPPDILTRSTRSDRASWANGTVAVGSADRLYRGGFAATPASPFQSARRRWWVGESAARGGSASRYPHQHRPPSHPETWRTERARSGAARSAGPVRGSGATEDIRLSGREPAEGFRGVACSLGSSHPNPYNTVPCFLSGSSVSTSS